MRRAHQAAPHAALSVRKRRVLVADDNRDAADSLGMLLEALGAEVRVVHSGPEALAVFPGFVPSLVLLDIGMPDMDGYEVARRMRSFPGPHAMIVAVTGWGQEEDRRRARAAGFDHHLTKPADVEDLQRLLSVEAARGDETPDSFRGRLPLASRRRDR
jgi:CheY-like chemotaxis protein